MATEIENRIHGTNNLLTENHYNAKVIDAEND